MLKKFHEKQTNKRIISRLLVAALMSSTLLTTNVTAAQPSLTKVNTPQAYTFSGNYCFQIIDSSWGLGTYQTEYVANNKPYNWYIDQGNTGSDANNNCGPSCTVMALKWLRSNYQGTVEDARKVIPAKGGWWYTSDIENYLKYNNVTTYSVQKGVNETSLKNQIRQGNIVILCINAGLLPYNSNSEQRVGRFYTYDSGHFIIIKGYRVVDGNTYFEAYDPNSWNATYSDGQLKGKDRYYLSRNLVNAASSWWDYAIVISPEQ
jgi:hypothetical protein